MAELKDTSQRHAADLLAGNMAGLMGDFTPAGMAKAMVLAVNPIMATSFEVKDLGNNAVHSHRAVPTTASTAAVRELFHVCYWLARTYARQVPEARLVVWSDAGHPGILGGWPEVLNAVRER